PGDAGAGHVAGQDIAGAATPRAARRRAPILTGDRVSRWPAEHAAVRLADPLHILGAVNTEKSNTQAQGGLASWLGGGSVFFVMRAVGASGLCCVIPPSRFAQRRARVRAQRAGASARELRRRAGEDAFSGARVLAERPALQRLIENEGSGGLEPSLRRFGET